MQKYKMVFKIEKEKKYLRILGKEFANTNNNKGELFSPPLFKEVYII